MEWQISERRAGSVTIVHVQGRLMYERDDELDERLKNLVESGQTKILLECSNVTAIDSSGIGAVAKGLNRAVRAGGSLKLLNPSPRMREALVLVGLQQVLETFTDEKEATASFT